MKRVACLDCLPPRPILHFLNQSFENCSFGITETYPGSGAYNGVFARFPTVRRRPNHEPNEFHYYLSIFESLGNCHIRVPKRTGRVREIKKHMTEIHAFEHCSLQCFYLSRLDEIANRFFPTASKVRSYQAQERVNSGVSLERA